MSANQVHAVRIVNVEIIMALPFVLVCLVSLEVLRLAGLSVLSRLNVLSINLASNRNALIHASRVFAEQMLTVELIVIVRSAHAETVTQEIPSPFVIRYHHVR